MQAPVKEVHVGYKDMLASDREGERKGSPKCHFRGCAQAG